MKVDVNMLTPRSIELGIKRPGTSSAEVGTIKYLMTRSENWMGSDAELVDGELYLREDTLANTNWNGWTPSTTEKSLVGSTTAKTIELELAKYSYYIVWECSIVASYLSGGSYQARAYANKAYIAQEIGKRPSSYANVKAGNFNENRCETLYAENGLIYFSGLGNKISWLGDYGWYFKPSSCSFSDSTSDNPSLTVKTPMFYARCSSTYFSTTNAGYIDAENSNWYIKGKLYRVKTDGIIRGLREQLVELL